MPSLGLLEMCSLPEDTARIKAMSVSKVMRQVQVQFCKAMYQEDSPSYQNADPVQLFSIDRCQYWLTGCARRLTIITSSVLLKQVVGVAVVAC